MLQVGNGRFDPLRGELSLDGRTTQLRPRTAALLAHLVRNADRVVGKDELLRTVWPDAVVTEDSLVQCVKEIRRALGRQGRDWIRTMPRRGYAFVAEAQSASALSPRIADPVRRRGLHFVIAVLALGVLTVISIQLLRRADSAVSPPSPPLSIVVLPLLNLTGETVLDNDVDELTESLTTALSRLSGATVIAASTAFAFKGKPADVRRVGAELHVRYVLEGSLRGHDSRRLLTMRLADASTAVQLWSEGFPLDTGQMPALRDEIVARVAGRLGLQLITAEAQRSQRERRDDPAATDLLTLARAALRWSGQGAEGIAKARMLLEEAVRRDNDLAEAWALLAWAYLDEVRFSTTRERSLLLAADAAKRALELTPESADAHGAKARLLYNEGRMAQALAAFERAIELNPSDPRWHANRGAALIMLGKPDEALRAIGRAVRLSPRDPQLPLWEMFQGVAYLHMGRDDEAIELLARSVEGSPSSAFSHLFLASALGNAGHIDKAQAQISQLRQLHSNFTLARLHALEPSDAPMFRAQRQRVYDGLRRAGMPE
jgi:TolB-like protein/DNA-binding winged helix-turn-helix (wHTH) protein/Tfp pilus assembly protein PilF